MMAQRPRGDPSNGLIGGGGAAAAAASATGRRASRPLSGEWSRSLGLDGAAPKMLGDTKDYGSNLSCESRRRE